MDKEMLLNDVVAGRRVLFVDAIRSDIPSGGNTATAKLKKTLCHASAFHNLELNPAKGMSPMAGMLCFILASFPAVLFVYWLRRSHKVWLEFFLRLSPYFFLKCLWWRLRYRPDCVFLNHHATFLYGFAFKGCRTILVWHDVPSLKRDAGGRSMVDARRCAGLERSFLLNADHNLTFSLDDRKVLRRLHGERSLVIPVIADAQRQRALSVHASRLLLIGNWTRIENTEGTTAFLLAYASRLRNGPAVDKAVQFHVAGHGAVDYVAEVRRLSADASLLSIEATAFYRDIIDFDEPALLAPLLRGAGIKLKTIEAWSCGIPVIGTKQAFTGIPASITKLGGIQCVSPAEIAERCSDMETLLQDIASLDPGLAYEKYQEAVRGEETHAAVMA